MEAFRLLRGIPFALCFLRTDLPQVRNPYKLTESLRKGRSIDHGHSSTQ